MQEGNILLFGFISILSVFLSALYHQFIGNKCNQLPICGLFAFGVYFYSEYGIDIFNLAPVPSHFYSMPDCPFDFACGGIEAFGYRGIEFFGDVVYHIGLAH